MPTGSFTTDITTIRQRARQKMEEGPVTGSYGKDPTYETFADEEEHADDIVDLLGA